jgi:hypothetical protein
VHADQRFSFVRPLRTGDKVIATLIIDKVRVRAGSELVSTTVDISSTDAEPICSSHATFLHTREAS